jgi:hypothetical protein
MSKYSDMECSGDKARIPQLAHAAKHKTGASKALDKATDSSLKCGEDRRIVGEKWRKKTSSKRA